MVEYYTWARGIDWNPRIYNNTMTYGEVMILTSFVMHDILASSDEFTDEEGEILTDRFRSTMKMIRYRRVWGAVVDLSEVFNEYLTPEECGE